MSHEPEKDAAAYLGGELSRRRRRSFEAHIIECDDCWHEVETGRRGRAVAESGRELAPQPLRERVRATVEAMEHGGRRWRWRYTSAIGIVAVIAALLAAPLLFSSSAQPPVIDAVLADFRGGHEIGTTSSPALPARLGDLRLKEARAGSMSDMSVVIHVYEDNAGHQVTVYQADRTFPVAREADHGAGGVTWTARTNGILLYCSDRPIPSLVVGDDSKEVLKAAEELDL